jgi:hypothetical protein
VKTPTRAVVRLWVRRALLVALGLGVAWASIGLPGCSAARRFYNPQKKYGFADPKSVASKQANIVRNSVPQNRSDY